MYGLHHDVHHFSSHEGVQSISSILARYSKVKNIVLKGWPQETGMAESVFKISRQHEKEHNRGLFRANCQSFTYVACSWQPPCYFLLANRQRTSPYNFARGGYHETILKPPVFCKKAVGIKKLCLAEGLP
jgi:hypothetical protein